MQFLSLKAVSEGILATEEDLRLWYVVEHLALMDEKKALSEAGKGWAWGTLAELYLLKPLIFPEPKEFLSEIQALPKKYDNVKESTARQFDRYIYWWPELFKGIFPVWLKENAKKTRKILPSMKKFRFIPMEF